MAARAITALFDNYEEAAKAVDRIEAEGVPHDDISIVAQRPGTEAGSAAPPPLTRDASDGTAETAAGGTTAGAAMGSVLGGGAGLLAGLGLLAIPGLGPVVAAGWLVAALTGAGVGAAAGGLLGALTGAGLSEAEAETYAEGVRRGGTLITVRTDEHRADRVFDILKRSGSIDLDERVRDWRDQGWRGASEASARREGPAGAWTGDEAARLDPDAQADRDSLVPHGEPKPTMDPLEAPTTRQLPGEIR